MIKPYQTLRRSCQQAPDQFAGPATPKRIKTPNDTRLNAQENRARRVQLLNMAQGHWYHSSFRGLTRTEHRTLQWPGVVGMRKE